MNYLLYILSADFKKSCLSLLLILAACSRGEPGDIIDGKVAVTVDKPRVEEKKVTLSLPATLEPSGKIIYRFPIDVKIEKVAVRLGESVSQGTLLFELNGADLSLKLATLKARREEKKSLSDKNGYFLENRDRLLGEGKIDQTQYNSMEVEVNKSRTEFERLDAEVREMENQISNALINAPFDGVIAELSIAGGAQASAGELLLSLVRIDPIYVSFFLPSAESASVSLGMDVDVTIEGFREKTFQVPVTFVGPELDPATKTFEVKATLENKNYVLKGGAEAQVRFLSQTSRKILTIPAQALLKEGEKEYVYIVRENRAWPARVYTKKEFDNPETVEIQEGLKEKDMVVTQGQESLQAGSEVNLWR